MPKLQFDTDYIIGCVRYRLKFFFRFVRHRSAASDGMAASKEYFICSIVNCDEDIL